MPVIPCNLSEATDYPIDHDLYGFLFPLSPRVLLIIIDKKLCDVDSGRISEILDSMSPSKINTQIVCYATELVFAKGDSYPVFEHMEEIESNPGADKSYSFYLEERKRSNSYKPKIGNKGHYNSNR